MARIVRSVTMAATAPALPAGSGDRAGTEVTETSHLVLLFEPPLFQLGQ